jgi:ubiquinone/menaquinone biosynthesis C-methylase UbiE
MSTYVLRGGSEGARRLRILAEVSWPATERLLGRVGVQEGWRCLDAGCGIGYVAIKLAGMVGETGRSAGEDFDAEALEVAREEARHAGVGVEFRQRALSDLEDGEGYDLVYARFLLSHLGEPAEGLARLIGAAKPGGVVVVEDVDFRSCFSWPPSAAVERYAELYRDTAERLGADPLIGPKLVGMFLDAGLRDVSFDAIQPLFHEGDGKLMPQVTMEHIRERVVSEGLASDEEINVVVEELDRLRLNPRSLMGHPRIFQVWGYRADG